MAMATSSALPQAQASGDTHIDVHVTSRIINNSNPPPPSVEEACSAPPLSSAASSVLDTHAYETLVRAAHADAAWRGKASPIAMPKPQGNKGAGTIPTYGIAPEPPQAYGIAPEPPQTYVPQHHREPANTSTRTSTNTSTNATTDATSSSSTLAHDLSLEREGRKENLEPNDTNNAWQEHGHGHGHDHGHLHVHVRKSADVYTHTHAQAHAHAHTHINEGVRDGTGVTEAVASEHLYRSAAAHSNIRGEGDDSHDDDDEPLGSPSVMAEALERIQALRRQQQVLRHDLAGRSHHDAFKQVHLSRPASTSSASDTSWTPNSHSDEPAFFASHHHHNHHHRDSTREQGGETLREIRLARALERLYCEHSEACDAREDERRHEESMRHQMLHDIADAERERDRYADRAAFAEAEAARLDAIVADAAEMIAALKARCGALEQAVYHARLQTACERSKAALAEAEAEDSAARAAAAAAFAAETASKAVEGAGGGGAGFSLANIRSAIRQAVSECEGVDEDERAKRLRALKARWHPDRNPILKELAEEVSKELNAACDELAAKTST